MNAIGHMRVWTRVYNTLTQRTRDLLAKGRPEEGVVAVLATAELARAVANAYSEEAKNAPN